MRLELKLVVKLTCSPMHRGKLEVTRVKYSAARVGVGSVGLPPAPAAEYSHDTHTHPWQRRRPGRAARPAAAATDPRAAGAPSPPTATDTFTFTFTSIRHLPATRCRRHRSQSTVSALSYGQWSSQGASRFARTDKFLRRTVF